MRSHGTPEMVAHEVQPRFVSFALLPNLVSFDRAPRKAMLPPIGIFCNIRYRNHDFKSQPEAVV